MKINTLFYLFKYSMAKRGALREFKKALNNEALTANDLEALNWQKTKKLLDYAYEHVPYYKRIFDQINLHPKDIITQEDFEKIPVLRREDIIQHYESLFSNEVEQGRMKISTTGGSTGDPLKIAMSPKSNREVPKWRMLAWWGLTPNVNMATLYRDVPVSRLKKTVLNFINWPQEVVKFDATSINESDMITFVENIQRVKPKLIHGYVGALDALSDYILEHNIEISAPQTVWATAAPVTKVQEEKISRAFNAPVCDQYGCSEIYFISAECSKKEGLHIFHDSLKVEFLDDGNRSVEVGEYGQLAVTNLDEYGFPLIRYLNGDEGRYLDHECSCGISLPVMDKVKGRISDNIILPSGRIISGEYLTTIFDDFTDDVKKFQIVQRKDKSIDINVVLFDIQNQDNIFKFVRSELGKRVKNEVPVNLNIVESIKSIKGKLQFIIKEIK